jgi:hypothetical protein
VAFGGQLASCFEVLPGELHIMAYWSYRLPDVVLTALCYLLMARLLMSLVSIPDNAIVRGIGALTGPIVSAVGAITPRIVPTPFVILAALSWIYAARVVLRAGIAATGMRLVSG